MDRRRCDGGHDDDDMERGGWMKETVINNVELVGIIAYNPRTQWTLMNRKKRVVEVVVHLRERDVV